jgi:glycogen operon protein
MTLGVTPSEGGVAVAVFSAAADTIEFCTFDANDAETGRFALAHRTGDIHHDFVPCVPPGTRYGLRAHGPFAPRQGHRFNPNKLLLDPYATAIDRPHCLHPSLFDTGDAPSTTDSAAFVPKAFVVAAPEPAAPPPRVAWDSLVIYELHVRGFSMLNNSVPQAQRGTFAGLAHPASIDYLQRLGITAVELLPCAAWIDERHLPPLGLSNYWGYNPVTFAAPDPRLAPGGFAEIRATVAALRQAGIATILDVVFNHSGESDHFGPTLSFRGLDNASYYRLDPNDRARYVNDAGCGNILAADHPGVVRLVMDALRLWATATGADGFRFDLASTLGRTAEKFDPHAPLLAAIAQDPVLRDRLLIAEPWDIGPGGYQLGHFGAPWAEWNDRFRDTARRFWRGDGGTLGDMATRLAGSADLLAASHRPPSRSINYITAHDGFTLRDLLSYTRKRNDANGEQNRDGTDTNLSWNHGAEGPADNPGIVDARARDARALLATLLLSRGTPMLSMGDESGRTQQGNNNAYAQDNALSWLDWNNQDRDLFETTRRLIAVRRAAPALHEDRLLTGIARPDSDLPDVAWLRADGTPMATSDWEDPRAATLIALLYTPPDRALLVLHAGWDGIDIRLPPARDSYCWRPGVDTGRHILSPMAAATANVGPRSVLMFFEQPLQVAGADSAVSQPTLNRLATEAGLSLAWWDVGGQAHAASPDTLRALLAAQSLPAATEAQARDSLVQLAARRDLRPLPASLVIDADTPARLRIGPGTGGRDRWLAIAPESDPESPVHVKIAAEDGEASLLEAADGRRLTVRHIGLPPLPSGRYSLALEGIAARSHLTVAPPCCHLPSPMMHGGRAWGIATHLYTLRRITRPGREGDQGIGDFSALAELAAVGGQEGATVLGLNPLHALFRQNPDRASPYHPADRRFLNPIYIDVTDLGPLNDTPAVRAALAAEAGGLTALRDAAAVDYRAVWQMKDRVLQAAFAAADPATEAALDAFIAEGGHALRDFTVWEALSEAVGIDWHVWPDAFARPDATAVADFAAAHAARIRYSGFLQFLAERGLAAAAAAGREAGLAIGIYRDLAVGCAPDGAEAWSDQSLLLRGASIGAPPDPLGPLGQVWHLPAPHPLAMAESGYRAFAGLLAANMRHAGALRIDHVMGLSRLFLVPDGGDARDGTYLSYPLHDLLGQVALESARAACLVIGEDLGTVPPELGTALAARSVLSYRVLWFEQDHGRFRPPAAWPRLAATCVSTHDLPTFLGWWSGADIGELAALGLLDPAGAAVAREARQSAKAAILDLLRQENLLVDESPGEPPLVAVHALIARTPAVLALVQADDLAGERVGVNLPGTDMERPNWRRRLASNAASFRGHPVLAAMRRERPTGAPDPVT